MAQAPETPASPTVDPVFVSNLFPETTRKMVSPRARLKRLAWQLGLLFLLYALCRVLFIAVHHTTWQASGSAFRMLWGGLRFDASAIAMTNALFIALSLLPFAFVERRGWQKGLRACFVG